MAVNYKIISQFAAATEEPVLTINPFVKNMVECQYTLKKLKEPTLEAFNSTKGNCSMEELVAEPEDVLDFDASEYPEHFHLFIPFKKKRLDNLTVACGIKKLKNKMLFELCIIIDAPDYYKFPFNFIRMRYEIAKRCKAYGFIADHVDVDSESADLQFEIIRPAKGNMLQTFNAIWKDVETLYFQSRNGIIEEIIKSR